MGLLRLGRDDGKNLNNRINMRIENVLIEDKIKKKILRKHNVESSEIKETLLNQPIVLKSKWGRYSAIGKYQRH